VKKAGASGGAAMQRGAEHQNRVTARFLVHLLAEEAFAFPGGDRPFALKWVRCETDEQVDDIHVKVESHDGEYGFVWVQCKTHVGAEKSEDSQLASALDQFIRQWEYCSATTTDPDEWQRPLHPSRDALVLAVASGPAKIINHLPAVLTRLRRNASPRLEDATRNANERAALKLVVDHVHRLKPGLSSEQIQNLLSLIRIVSWNLADGTDEHQHLLRLLGHRSVTVGGDPAAAWDDLVRVAGVLAQDRDAVDRAALCGLIRFSVQSPQRFSAPIATLKKWTEATHARLKQHGEVPGAPGAPPIHITRVLASDLAKRVVAEGLALGHIAVVGEAGAGKTGVLVDVVGDLTEARADVVFIAIEDLDRLPKDVAAAELPDVLANWSGPGAGYLVVDALDAARTDSSFGATKRLLEDVSQRCERWRIIASIRSWDLRYGPTWGDIFRARRGAQKDARIDIGSLLPPEIEQLRTGFPDLHRLLISASESDRPWMWTPFHVHLAADLLHDGVPISTLAAIHGAPELVERWWTERVRGGSPSECHRSVELLRRIAVALLSEQRLRLPIAKLELDPITLARQRSQGVLDGDQATIAFAHHALFDFAVAELLLNVTDPSEFVAAIQRIPDFSLVARPSLRIHFHRTWLEDRATFWSHVIALERSPVPRIAKVLGPAEAARGFCSVDDLAPALSGLDATETADGWEAVLSQVVGALDDPGFPFQAARWTAVAAALSSQPSAHALSLAGYLIPRLVPHDAALPDRERSILGHTARLYLRRRLEQAPGLSLRSAVESVCTLFTSDVLASVLLLRRLLSERWAEHGHELIYVLAEHMDRFIASDTEFATAVFLTALGFRESREGAVPLGGHILAFSVTPASTYDSGLHTLRRLYPQLLRASLRGATDVLVLALEVFFSRHDRELPAPEAFTFRGRTARIQPDYSSIWFKGSAHYDEHRLLNEWDAEVVAHVDRGGSLVGLLDQLVDSSGLACVWRAMLEHAVRDPVRAGHELREACWAVPILLAYDLQEIVPQLLSALHPVLSLDDKLRMEAAILSIGTVPVPENPAFTDYATARLLAAIPHLESEAARATKEMLAGVVLLPESVPDSAPIRMDPSVALARIRGVDVHHPGNAVLLDLTAQLRRAAEPYLNTPPAAEAVAGIVSLIERSLTAISEPHGAQPGVVTDTLGYLAQAAQRCAECRELETNPSAARVVRDVLVAAVAWEGLPRREDDDRQYGGSWGMPDSPISAAQGLCRLGASSALATADVLSSIETLSVYPAAAVRGQLLQRIWWLHERDPERMWRILDERMGNERSDRVLQDALHSSVGMLGRRWPDRACALAMKVAGRPSVGESRGGRDEALALMTHLHVAKGLDLPLPVLERVVADVRAAPADAGALAHPIAQYLVLRDAPGERPNEVRSRAWVLMRSLCVVGAQAWRAARDSADTNASRALAPVLDRVLLELKEAVDEDGLRQLPRADRVLVKKRFFSDATLALEALADLDHPRMVHHFIEVVSGIAEGEPEACLLLIDRAVKHGGRAYAAERLGLEGVTSFLRWLMAEHRDVVAASPACRAATMAIVDTFLEAGWPEARRLADDIDRWFR
jgi:hypothetical protein